MNNKYDNSTNKCSEKNTFEKIYDVVRKIPKGKVCTYGQVATLVGNPHLSQIVGFALHSNPDQSTIPCHRVVNRFGKVAKAFAFGGGNMQHELLTKEGVTFLDDETVDMKNFMWYGE